ncbi:MAG: phospholipase D family protein [Rhodobacteraceae bacterium]|nr:phospholipase D family protein [Paracoccaceae bacterium]
MRFLRYLLKTLAVMAIFILVLRWTHPLPESPAGDAAVFVPAGDDTRLGQTLLPLINANPDKTGVIPFADGRDAFVARILLARAATKTIDVQYYIWQTDTTGWLLLDELRKAAERGVRVRMLLDDNGIPGLDNVLADLASMENIEIRLFNPFTMRKPKLASYVFDFFRLNRRMHNKSMTVDGVATIVGGRNIGDIYFAYGEDTAYFDFDVLAVGPGAAAVSKNFIDYWTSGSSYDALDILNYSNKGLAEMIDAVSMAAESVRGSDYARTLDNAPVISRLMAGEDLLEWTSVKLFSDDPAKGLGQAKSEDLLITRMTQVIGQPERSLDLVSAYLIPGQVGTALFLDFLKDGVKTRLVTNSLESNDVPIVHSAWKDYRNQLVRAGADVLELRARLEQPKSISLTQILTSSQSSLHAKTFAVDGERIFIGSFNFDPRSAALNTEMGFLIDSPRIARSLSAALDGSQGFYRVFEDEDGKIRWSGIEDDEQKEWVSEPNTSAFQRGIVNIMSYLPLEWVL